MSPREQTFVTFQILSSTLSVNDIADRSGLIADTTWKAGDRRGHFGAEEKKNGFILESKLPEIASLDDHVKAMLRRLAPTAQKIGTLAGECSIEFLCTVHRKTAPMLRFERDDLRWLGVMGARLDVDIFVLKEPGSSSGPQRSQTPNPTPTAGGPA